MDTTKLKNKFYSWSGIMINNKLIIKELETVLRKLIKEYKNPDNLILPARRLVFRAYEEVHIDQCEYVMLGLDPYTNFAHGFPSACGLSFITENGYTNPSLKVLLESLNLTKSHEFKKLVLEDKKCLMLNVALTVKHKQTNSHLNIWKHFSELMISEISKQKPNIKWILLGREAQRYSEFIRDKEQVYKAPHPASYSYSGDTDYKELKLLFKELKWI